MIKGKKDFRRDGRHGFVCRRFSWLACVTALSFVFTTSAHAGTNALHLADFVRLVLERNENAQMKLLDMEIARHKSIGEYGVFEPAAVLSASREENKRENTAEQRRSLGVPIFEEKNNNYNGGLEALVPSGAKVRLGYSLRDLRNNLQQPQPGTIASNAVKNEYQTFLGFSVSQPVLKDFGYDATLANIRLAALASEVAYEDYRRQLIELISTAEATYWNLYMAQEQVRFFEESVSVAESLVRDNRVRAEAGKGAELEVLEAEAGLALRRSKLAEAQQKYNEAATKVMTLYSESAIGNNALAVALDHPEIGDRVPDFFETAQTAFELNPDYRSQQNKLKQEDVRIAYASNQRLPQLDLKASYGLNGLGQTPGSSWDDIERQDFPSWSIGFEMRVPLAGDIKARHELAAARLRKEQALVGLKQAETQIINAIQAALQKLRSAHDSVLSYRTVVTFNENLLKTQLERVQVGKIESRKVLETEAALFEARNSVADAMVQYERARLELELVQGAVLKLRNFDFSQRELQTRTARALRERSRAGGTYQELMAALYAQPPAPVEHVDHPFIRGITPQINSENYPKAQRALEEKFDQLDRQPPAETLPPPGSAPARPPMDQDNYNKAIRALREKLQQLDRESDTK